VLIDGYICGCTPTYLGAVEVERRFFVPQFNRLGVKVNGSGPVLVLESFVALVLELGSFFLRVPHDACRSAGHGAGVCEAQRNRSGKRDGYVLVRTGEGRCDPRSIKLAHVEDVMTAATPRSVPAQPKVIEQIRPALASPCHYSLLANQRPPS
jgi:hypothetical protein